MTDSEEAELMWLNAHSTAIVMNEYQIAEQDLAGNPGNEVGIFIGDNGDGVIVCGTRAECVEWAEELLDQMERDGWRRG